jgi:hypothetical protein
MQPLHYHKGIMPIISGVGTPVTRSPRHRPGRAVFPHPVPRLYSHSRGPSQLPVTRPSCYCPTVRLARVYPILHVRHEFPVWAAYSRRVLRHVAGFPDLRLLCPIRHPVGIRRTPAYLVAPCATTPPKRTPLQGSSPSRVPAQSGSSSHCIQEPAGLPEFSNVSLPACHGLRTPADIHALAINERFMWASSTLKLSPSAG